MAPDLNTHDDSILSPVAAGLFEKLVADGGLRGGDGDDAPAPGDGAPATPAEGVPAEGETPAVAETPAEGETPEGDGDTLIIPEDLSGIEAESLTTLHAEVGEAIATARETARTPGDVQRVRDLVAERQRIAGEVQRRIDEDRSVRDELATLDEELAAETALPELPVPVASMTPRAPSSREIAAARGAQTPAAQAPPAPATPRVSVPLLAAVGGGGVSVGGEMSLSALGEVLDRVKKGNARTVVASLQPYEELPSGSVPEILGSGSTNRNSEMMREARTEHAAARRGSPMQAAVCTPLDIIRDIPSEFNTAEPVSSMFPSRPAGRLGFQFFRSVELSAVAGAVAEWSEVDQASVDVDDPDTWKVCLDVECPTAESIVASAVVACLTWDLTSEMSNPENIANLTAALTALRARAKEGKILKAIDANSYRYTYEGAYGAVPTVIDLLNTLVAQATFASRLDESMFSAILPPGVVQLLAIDLANRGYNSDTVTDVLAYVKERVPGIGEVVSSLDTATGGQPGLPFFPFNGPLGGSPEVLPSLEALSGGFHRIRVLDPDDFLYAETGALNVGTTRDSQLLRANKVQYFAEEFTLLAKQGPSPAFSVDVRLCGDGARAGLVEPVGCTS